MPAPLLGARGLTKRFSVGRVAGGGVDYIRAVDGVDLTVDAGETLGLVGESGSGKSTLGRALLRLIEPTAGSVTFDGADILALRPEALRRLRARMQMVFQDPFASLNPRMRIGDAIAEPLVTHGVAGRKDAPTEVARLLARVGLAADLGHRFPHEFSGGQRQRIGIARALASRPKLIVADEPVSALDVSLRAQILDLFRSVQDETGTAIVFIGHDLGVVRRISHRVAVIYLGAIVETGESEDVFTNPLHPYTRLLLDSAPKPGRKRQPGPADDTPPPSPIDIPSGCRFRTRCPFVQAVCSEQVPPLKAGAGAAGHASACHFAAELPQWTSAGS
jgi:oligopeptide/dipeptide ABC transporter ATP-binding protein